MRESRPCVILGPEYEWRPVMERSWRLRGVETHTVYMWASTSGLMSVDNGNTKEDSYKYTFEEAARIIETRVATGVY